MIWGPLVLLGALQVQSASACPSADEVRRRLQPLLREQSARERRAELTVEANDLIIHLYEDARPVRERRLRGKNNCDDLAQASAVILAAWLSDLDAASAPTPAQTAADAPDAGRPEPLSTTTPGDARATEGSRTQRGPRTQRTRTANDPRAMNDSRAAVTLKTQRGLRSPTYDASSGEPSSASQAAPTEEEPRAPSAVPVKQTQTLSVSFWAGPSISASLNAVSGGGVIGFALSPVEGGFGLCVTGAALGKKETNDRTFTRAWERFALTGGAQYRIRAQGALIDFQLEGAAAVLSTREQLSPVDDALDADPNAEPLDPGPPTYVKAFDPGLAAGLRYVTEQGLWAGARFFVWPRAGSHSVPVGELVLAGGIGFSTP
ncbi:MAG: hypothetical protein ACT4TC_16825 [Myxococcaceae bacterium]